MIQPAAVRADPKIPRLVIRDGPHGIRRKPVARGEYLPRLPIPARQPIRRAHPQPPRAILMQRGNLLPQAARHLDQLKLAVAKLMQPAARACAHPHLPRPVREYRQHIRADQSILGTRHAVPAEIFRHAILPAHHAAAREADPQRALGILACRLHHAPRSLGHHVTHPALHPVQPAAVRAHPQIPLAIQAHRQHARVRQPILRPDPRELPRAVGPIHARVQHPDDQVALLILARAGDACVRHVGPRIIFQHPLQLVRAPLLHVSVRHAPEPALPARQQKIQLRRLQLRDRRKAGAIRRRNLSQHDLPLIRSHPDAARRVRDERPAQARLPMRHHRETVAEEPTDLSIRRVKPHPAIRILTGRHHLAAARTRAEAEARHRPIAQQYHAPAIRAHPQPSATVLEQKHDGIARQPGRVALIENREAIPVEAHQPVQSSQPQITIPRLEH